jgi:hypothetical protein
MRGHIYGPLLMKLAALVVLFVLINSATYILLLQKFLGGRATYYPFVVSTGGAIALAIIFAWRSAGATRASLARAVLCLSSAVIVGTAVILLSLLIIVNTLGA